MPALSVLRTMPNSIANYIAIEFGIGGANSTISNACISSAEAIGAAYQQITDGRLSTAICGGTESFIWESILAAWCKLRVMSTKTKPLLKRAAHLILIEMEWLLLMEPGF